jgi:hypothetical protein
MTIRLIGAMLGAVLLVPVTTMSGFAQVGGHTPAASASPQEIAEHMSTVRAEALYLKCKQQFGVWPGNFVKANNAATGACMRNGGKVPYTL